MAMRSQLSNSHSCCQGVICAPQQGFKGPGRRPKATQAGPREPNSRAVKNERPVLLNSTCFVCEVKPGVCSKILRKTQVNVCDFDEVCSKIIECTQCLCAHQYATIARNRSSSLMLSRKLVGLDDQKVRILLKLLLWEGKVMARARWIEVFVLAKPHQR